MRYMKVADLTPGMVLARTVINEDMVVVLSENTLLTKAHITRLGFLNIDEVIIKDEYDLNPNAQAADALLNRATQFATEYKEVVNKAQDIFSQAGKSDTIPPQKTENIVKQDLAPMSKQSGAIDYLYDLNQMSSDAYQHSMRVSILAGVIAKWLRKSKKETNEIIMAGFLHDIGKTKFPDRLKGKRVENMKGEDFDEYVKHTTAGQRILAQTGGIPESIQLAVLQHHECMDGTGFPFGIRGDEIHEYARILAVANLYDNLTTEREGAVRQTPFTAIAKITEQMYTKLDPNICVVMLKQIKNAFLGSTIVLSNGLTGVIVNYPFDFAEHPLVEVEGGQIIDLNTTKGLKIIEYNPKPLA